MSCPLYRERYGVVSHLNHPALNNQCTCALEDKADVRPMAAVLMALAAAARGEASTRHVPAVADAMALAASTHPVPAVADAMALAESTHSVPAVGDVMAFGPYIERRTTEWTELSSTLTKINKGMKAKQIVRRMTKSSIEFVSIAFLAGNDDFVRCLAESKIPEAVSIASAKIKELFPEESEAGAIAEDLVKLIQQERDTLTSEDTDIWTFMGENSLRALQVWPPKKTDELIADMVVALSALSEPGEEQIRQSYRVYKDYVEARHSEEQEGGNFERHREQLSMFEDKETAIIGCVKWIKDQRVGNKALVVVSPADGSIEQVNKANKALVVGSPDGEPTEPQSRHTIVLLGGMLTLLALVQQLSGTQSAATGTGTTQGTGTGTATAEVEGGGGSARSAAAAASMTVERVEPGEPVWGVFGKKMYVKRGRVWRKIDGRSAMGQSRNPKRLNIPHYEKFDVGSICGTINADGTLVLQAPAAAPAAAAPAAAAPAAAAPAAAARDCGLR